MSAPLAERGRGELLDGILVVDKPRGPTSHDIVARARRHFGTRRVGHAGTLDPMATGVLVLLFGEATKLCEVATASDKSYVADIRFGRSTVSHDAEGETTEELQGPVCVDPEALRRALDNERQRTLQLPPTVSAIKVQGRRAHHLTRQGAAPELERRGVHVRSICERDIGADHVSLELCVSKGYYVRALVRDLSAALGVPAHLTALRRVASGCFTLAEAHAWPPPDDCRVLELAELMPRLLPTFRLNERGVQRARRGQVLERDDFVDALPAEADGADVCAWIDVTGTPVALGGRSGAGYRVRRGFSALASVTDRRTESSRAPQ